MKSQPEELRLSNSSSAASISMLTVLAIVVAAVTALGCAWNGTSHSVRFNGYQTEREMRRLPPLPTLANGLNEARKYWDIEDEPEREDDSGRRELPEEGVNALWDRAEAAEKDGNLRLGRELLVEYLKRTDASRDYHDYWDSSDNHQERRNSAIDRLDALTALNHGSKSSAVKAYLDARHLLDKRSRQEEIVRALDAVPSDFNLRDNVAYLRAAQLYRQDQFEQAASAFNALARQYSRSEKREAALFMTAVSTMKTSATYIPASGNAGYDYGKHEGVSTDQAWHEAFAAFERVINAYPRGRYFNEARGWQAYLFLRRQDRAGALAQYYRLLSDQAANARIEAAFSLTLVRSPATDDEMSRVEKDLADEPQAALAYAYHNIYNYSIDPGEAYPPYEVVNDSTGNYDYEASRARQQAIEQEWRKDRADTGRKELLRTLEFSKRLLASYPNLTIAGAFALRVAQASEELDDHDTARKFSLQALQARLRGEERAQALWILGTAEHQLGHFDAARKSLLTLLRDYPNTSLTEGARRLLAMIAEDAGDIHGALEQYIALDYTIDEDYFVDYLMTPEQLAAFIEKQIDSPKRNELVYALGIRYLRLNRWEDARNTFARVRTTGFPSYSLYCSSCNCRGDATTNCVDPKDPVSGERENPIITPNLLMRDVQTANDLEARERAVTEAVGDEAKAEALYQYASYQYEASSLLFYNPLASPGYWSLGQLADEGSYRAPDEAQILFNSQQEHERLARALKIYLEVAKQFPRTRAARDALYTAAVCHERLSNYNPYWRQIYQNGLHAGERMVRYADVKATYPNYQLPRGTYGWQPSTRTVNGGAGWTEAPKPPPRLTKRQRLNLFVNGLAEGLTSFWKETGRRWVTEIVIVLGLVFTARIALRNQKRLRTRIARHRIEQARQSVSYPWFELFWIDPERLGRRQQLAKFAQAKRQEFVSLVLDRRSRPVLLRSIFSHCAVSALLISLFWTILFG